MRPRRSTATAPPSLPVETSVADSNLLTHAYKAGLILSWKHDRERGYRLTLAGRADEYVQVTQLSNYLDKLRAGRS